MGKYRPSGNLIIANQVFATDAPIVNFRDCPWDAALEVCIPVEGFEATARACGPGGRPTSARAGQGTKRVMVRPALRRYAGNPPFAAVQTVIRKIVIHHDGVGSSAEAFAIMHNERGLSEHFYIDNDGTIYQTCDVAAMALHAADLNPDSIGIVLSNRGDARREPNFYKQRGLARDERNIRINSYQILAFDFTADQYVSLTRLLRALLRYLPKIPPSYPSREGRQLSATLPIAEARAFAGIMGNYHRSALKWDPGPLDFERVCGPLRGVECFPISSGSEPIELSSQQTLDAQAAALIANSSRASGRFPVGPWGTTALWHGGIHLTAAEGDPVFAPFSGTIVAARSSTTPLGSASFVLIRHDMRIGGAPATVFTLYMHLAPLDPRKPLPWVQILGGSIAPLQRGDVQLMNVPIQGGAVIGRVGVAGPPGATRAQLHLEMFSATELALGGLPAWTTIDGSATGRVCTAKQILANPAPEIMRRMVTYHVSEWCSEAGWTRALYGRPEVDDADIEQLIREQITPLLWWNEQVAGHCGLPSDGVVYHYHPIEVIQLHNKYRLSREEPTVPRVDDVDDRCNDMISINELVTGKRPDCPADAGTPDPSDIPTPPPAVRGGIIDL